MAHYQYKQEEDVAYASWKRKVVKLLKPTNEATVVDKRREQNRREAKHSHEPDKLPSDCRLPDFHLSNSISLYTTPDSNSKLTPFPWPTNKPFLFIPYRMGARNFSSK